MSLTTALDVLEAFQAVASNEELLRPARESGLLTQLGALFASKPVVQKADCAGVLECWVPESFPFLSEIARCALPATTAFLLKKAICEYSSGSAEKKQIEELCFEAADLMNTVYDDNAAEAAEKNLRVIDKILSLIDGCVAAGDFETALQFLETAYYNSPLDSGQETAAVEKGLEHFDAFFQARKYSQVQVLLERARDHFPTGDAKQETIKARQTSLNQRREFSLTDQLGTKESLPALQAAVVKELDVPAA